jgi:hypothetical protein
MGQLPMLRPPFSGSAATRQTPKGGQHGLQQRHVPSRCCCSAGGLGLTAIITAKAEPYRSWGAHLASFGAQAALVAESPYYKLLIGRVLGYKEDNIVHHIRVSGMEVGQSAGGG